MTAVDSLPTHCLHHTTTPHTEGQTRLFDVIRSAAEAREANPAGVWASFGQPYACLGQPQQVRAEGVAVLCGPVWQYRHEVVAAVVGVFPALLPPHRCCFSCGLSAAELVPYTPVHCWLPIPDPAGHECRSPAATPEPGRHCCSSGSTQQQQATATAVAAARQQQVQQDRQCRAFTRRCCSSCSSGPGSNSSCGRRRQAAHCCHSRQQWQQQQQAGRCCQAAAAQIRHALQHSRQVGEGRVATTSQLWRAPFCL